MAPFETFSDCQNLFTVDSDIFPYEGSISVSSVDLKVVDPSSRMISKETVVEIDEAYLNTIDNALQYVALFAGHGGCP